MLVSTNIRMRTVGRRGMIRLGIFPARMLASRTCCSRLMVTISASVKPRSSLMVALVCALEARLHGWSDGGIDVISLRVPNEGFSGDLAHGLGLPLEAA